MNIRMIRVAVLLCGVMSVPAMGMDLGLDHVVKTSLSTCTAAFSYCAIAAPTAGVLFSRGLIKPSLQPVVRGAFTQFAAISFLLGLALEVGWSIKSENKTTYPGAIGRGFLVGIPTYLCFLEMILKPRISFLG